MSKPAPGALSWLSQWQTSAVADILCSVFAPRRFVQTDVELLMDFMRGACSSATLMRIVRMRIVRMRIVHMRTVRMRIVRMRIVRMRIARMRIVRTHIVRS